MAAEGKSRLGGIAARVALGSVLPLILLLCWHLASRCTTVIPSIGTVADVLAHPFREPPNLDCKPLFDTVLISIVRVLAGFLLAVLTAVPLGMSVGVSRLADRLLTPFVEAMRPICPIAWLPVTIVAFGLASVGSLIWGEDAWRHGIASQLQLAMIFIIWWGAFFPLFVNTAAGVKGVRRLYIDAARALGASPRQIFFKVVFPASLPSIMTGLRVALGLAWMVIVAAEFFPGTSAGLGYMITTAHQTARYEYAFAAIIVIGVIGFTMNAVLAALAARLTHWEARER